MIKLRFLLHCPVIKARQTIQMINIALILKKDKNSDNYNCISNTVRQYKLR